MDKEFYDKYSKDLECGCYQDLEYCINGKEPLKINCAIRYFKDKIADLEAKLAEYQNDGVGDVIINSGKKIKELQQQLVEEKNRNKKLNHEAQKYYEDAYCNDFQNQTAIAELEKVKEYWLKHEDIGYYIDKQIKSLKGEK